LPKVRLSLALAEDENQAESSRRIVVSSKVSCRFDDCRPSIAAET
jgi:hypothetical protein